MAISQNIEEKIKQSLRECGITSSEIEQAKNVISASVEFMELDSIDSAFFNFKQKLEGVVEKFEDYGLSRGNYKGAALKKPQLFCQSSETIFGNVMGVIEKFRAAGGNLDLNIGSC